MSSSHQGRIAHGASVSTLLAGRCEKEEKILPAVLDILLLRPIKWCNPPTSVSLPPDRKRTTLTMELDLGNVVG